MAGKAVKDPTPTTWNVVCNTWVPRQYCYELDVRVLCIVRANAQGVGTLVSNDDFVALREIPDFQGNLNNNYISATDISAPNDNSSNSGRVPEPVSGVSGDSA